jgi:putative transposase
VGPAVRSGGAVRPTFPPRTARSFQVRCHTSEAVAVSLWEYRDRIDLHFLPKYSPVCNLIERVWWNLRDRITRNHQCRLMQELLDLTFAWLGSRNPFKVEDTVYRIAA